MQPYQQAGEAVQRQTESPGRLIKAGASIGASFLGGSAGIVGGNAMIRRVTPFLSKYIPEDLVVKGLSKINPRLGKFVTNAMESGQSLSEIQDFIGEKAQESQKSKDSRSIIEQYSPELHQFIQQEVQRGKTPMQAAGDAQTKVKWSSKFKDVIKKMEKDHKTPFSTIVESIFGGGQIAQPTPQQNNPGNQPSFADDVRQGLQQHLPQQSQQTELSPGIQAALNKIMSM